MTPSITIIGSGWLGAHFLRQHATEFSQVITTAKTQAQPYGSHHHILMDIYDPSTLPSLPPTDICLIAIPFSRQLTTPKRYTQAIGALLDHAPMYKKLIFTSSTSVYPTCNDWVDESSPIDTTPRAQALAATETRVKQHAKSTYILRLAGLCGGNRNSKHKCQAPTIHASQTPVNLIHVNDVVASIAALLSPDHSSHDTLNVCATDHPSKADYYRHVCKTLTIHPPQFEPIIGPYKKVCNKKLREDYGVKLTFKSPLEFTFHET